MRSQLADKHSLHYFIGKSDKQILKDVEDLKQALNKLRFEGRQYLRKNVTRTYSILTILRERLLSHTEEEENILFPFFLGTFPRLEAVQHLFSAEHKEFRDKIKDLLIQLKRLGSDRQVVSDGSLVHKIYSEGTYLTCLVTSHMKVESRELYKAIENRLNAGDKKKLSDLLILNA